MKNLIAGVLLIVSFFTSFLPALGQATVPSYKAWTKLLSVHVNEEGMVNYKGFVKDKAVLQAFLKEISDNPPTPDWVKEDQIAYWLNAYNANSVELILDHYPVPSILDIGPKPHFLSKKTVYDRKFILIGNQTMSLNSILKGILQKNFKEPRIYFALTGATFSGARLRREAYEASRLEKQLNDQTGEFVLDKTRNQLAVSMVTLSPLFKMYGKDIQSWSGKSLIGFINPYALVKIDEKAEIGFLEYNWNLNEQK